jgi:hypothetical protein
MNVADENVLIWAVGNWRGPETLAEYQEKSREILSAMRSLHPAFRRLVAIGDTPQEVPTDAKGIDHLIAKLAFDETHQEDYLDLQDGCLGPQSRSLIGFSISYMRHDDTEVFQGIRGFSLVLRGCSAAADATSNLSLKIAIPTLCEIGGVRAIKEILERFSSIWGSTHGGVSSRAYQQLIRERAPASYAGQWLFYLPFPHLAKCLPPDIHHEPFANGILIETTPHMPDANNVDDVAAGKRVRDVLDELGLVNDATYAIEGWPPDQEETIYEQFISGAPANRKYTVHCINFDGYDPDRKVLLYAKLFRRLKRHPKEWGFRGWDGPVLNEAKRQVRAAAKAGGVPIEWHIGLEEPAHQVRQLLADYTNITEQQLRVIYTPLEQALAEPPPS